MIAVFGAVQTGHAVAITESQNRYKYREVLHNCSGGTFMVSTDSFVS